MGPHHEKKLERLIYPTLIFLTLTTRLCSPILTIYQMDYRPGSEKMKPKCDMEVKKSKSEVMLGLHFFLKMTGYMHVIRIFCQQMSV